MAPTVRRTGLLIPVRSAEDIVGDFRRRHNAVSVARRIPPHITVLFPFAGAVDEALLSTVASHFSCFASFEAELCDVGRFDDYVWLAPQPRDRFVELIGATCARFPQYPPYEDAGIEPEPHLTIAAVYRAAAAVELAALADRELGLRLPFSFTVDGVSLFEEQSGGTWRETTRFELG
ncbi:MAG: 2'-5' RNA ligase family protein [Gaiellaceae bacterium]